MQTHTHTHVHTQTHNYTCTRNQMIICTTVYLIFDHDMYTTKCALHFVQCHKYCSYCNIQGGPERKQPL